MADLDRTLGTLVSDILTELKADVVTDLDDTEESTIVTNIILNTFWDMVANRDIPDHVELTRLDALGDSTRPTTLRIPATIKKVDWFKYNKTLTTTKEYRTVNWEDPLSFIERLNSRDSSASNVVTSLTVDNSVELLVYNDKHPSYWTSFDNKHIICDSYLASLDTTLQNSKTQILAIKVPSITRTWASSLDLEEVYIQFLYNEALSKASLRINETGDQKAEQWARRHRAAVQSSGDRTGRKTKVNDFGRS